VSGEAGLGGAALLRLAGRLAGRQWPRFLFFSACLSLGVGFLVAVSHLLAATDRAVALRSRELLAGDVEVRSPRPFGPKERAAFAGVAAPGRRTAESTALSSMLGLPAGEPVLVSVKAVDAGYPLRGRLETDPPGGAALLAGGGKALVERPLALQRGLEPGDRVKLGGLVLKVAGIILKEPDRGFGGFSFAPRLMIANADLPRAGLLGTGARVRRAYTIALADDEDPAAGSAMLKAQLEAALPEPHIGVGSYKDGEEGVRDGLRRAALFFTVLSLAALLLGAAGLRAGLTLFLDAQADTMGLLRCLGASAKEVERLYAGLCVGAGLLGGALGGAAGWGVAALAARLAPRFGVELSMPPDPASFAEGFFLAGALSWGLSAARVRALAARPPLDALRSAPPAPRVLVIAGWAVAGLAVAAAAWRRAGSAEEALKLTLALAAGALALELLSRAALRLAAWALGRAAALPLPARHGLRRIVRRPGPSRVMLFTLAGGFALLAAVATAREGLGRTLGAASAQDAPDLFLVDVQPSQLERAKALAAGRAGGSAEFAPLVRARLLAVDGRRVRRGEAGRDGPEARERRRLRAREYNLTYADALRPSERVVEGRFWAAGATQAEASVEKGFLERAGLKLGSRLTFEVSGREVEATVTSVREVDWSSMRPNFFVTLTPPLLRAAPQTYIASFRSRSPEDAAALRSDLAAALPNVSVIDAAAMLARVQEVLGLLLAATGALALFCVGVGALVTAGLAALGAEERAADAALERALGWTPAETLAADAAELAALGALSSAAASLTAVGLGWAVARRLGVPFAADPKEAAALALAALLLPVVAGLLAGASGRRRGVMDALRQES
jgi:putative ABC transport system permease protein